jgi:hypothetical protein
MREEQDMMVLDEGHEMEAVQKCTCTTGQVKIT